MINLSPLNRRRLNNFKKNRRAVWSFWIFSLLFGLSLFAEFIANDKPILVSYRGELFMPVTQFYPETAFGGDFQTEATYRDPEVQCLIRSGGLEICFDDPEGTMAAIDAGDFGAQVAEFSRGWMLWPPVPYSYDTPNDLGRAAPSPPDTSHWLGTDDTTRDVLARVIYGFRLSIVFALVVTVFASIIGIIAGALCAIAVGWKYKLGYDDSLDVVGVHLVGGLVGTLLIGFLATEAAPTGVNGLFYGGGVEQLGKQAIGAFAVMFYSLIIAAIIALVLKAIIGIRVDGEQETGGIDLAEHAETAYELGDSGGGGIFAGVGKGALEGEGK